MEEKERQQIIKALGFRLKKKVNQSRKLEKTITEKSCNRKIEQLRIYKKEISLLQDRLKYYMDEVK